MKARMIAKLSSLFIILIAVLVMLGWFFDIGLLKSIIPGGVTMKFVTALSFFFSGLILFFIIEAQKGSETAQVVLPISALIVLLLMGGIFLTSLLGSRIGFEDLFVKEGLGAVKTSVAGRPSIGTVVGFILIGVAGILAMRKYEYAQWLQTGSFIIMAGGVIALIGYIFGIPSLYYHTEGKSSAMAIHTAILFIIFGFGLFNGMKRQDGESHGS